MNPIRIQLSRRKGWRMPENTLKVCRPGKWGNPFTAEEFGRAEAVARHADYLKSQLASGALDLTELRGHNLACWCSLDGPCHADLLLRLANAS